MTSALSQEELRAMLHYDPQTGEFVWLVKPSKKLPSGAIAGGLNDEGYRVIRIRGLLHKAHRLAWLYVHGEWPAMCIDHINGVRDDNRTANLRCVSQRANMENQRFAHTNSKTGLLGVTQDAGRFTARIRSRGSLRYIGTYATPEEAAAAYIAKKRDLHPGCTI